MVDADGKSFSIPAERVVKQKMPLLYGPEGSEQDVLQGFQTMSQTLSAAKFTLKAVAMSARHSWQVTLDNDIRLELGRDDRMKRLQRFIDLYPKFQQQAEADKTRISYVDLRYDTGASVGWAPEFIDQQNSNQQQNQAQAKQQ
jgi:cell division protein FtsQ